MYEPILPNGDELRELGVFETLRAIGHNLLILRENLDADPAKGDPNTLDALEAVEVLFGAHLSDLEKRKFITPRQSEELAHQTLEQERQLHA